MNDNNHSDRVERERLHAEAKKVLEESRLSNSQLYDRAILTLSTSALWLSIAFIRFIVPIADAQCKVLLTISWYFFGLAIIVTILSFWASQQAIKVQLDHNYKYYMEKKDEFLTKTNPFAVATDIMNYLSGALFMAAVFFTILFVTLNI